MHQEITVRDLTIEQFSLQETAVLKEQESHSIDDQFPRITSSEKKKRHTTTKFSTDVSIIVGGSNKKGAFLKSNGFNRTQVASINKSAHVDFSTNGKGNTNNFS